jgi:hypothetical protein
MSSSHLSRALSALAALCLLGALAALARAFVVGLAWGGVETPVLTKARVETIMSMEAVLDERSAALVEASYSAPDRMGVRSLRAAPRILSPASELARAELSAEAVLADGLSHGWTRTSCASWFVRREMSALGYDVASLQKSYIFSRVADALGLLAIAVGAYLCSQRVLLLGFDLFGNVDCGVSRERAS